MNDKKIIFSSFAWKFAERMLSQGIGLIIQILIARLVKPEAIGEMAILLSVINIFSVISQSGFSSYIIQKRELSDKAVSTVSTFSILVSLLCIISFWILGDRFMTFIGYPDLGIYLKISGIILFFNAINGICTGLLSRSMQFKEMFKRTLIVLPISTGICFGFMLYGFDLEALIAYNIANPLCTSIFMLVLLKKDGYTFKFTIRRKDLKAALPYSMRVLIQDIGNVVCNSIRNFVMGGVYSSSSLAYYDRAFTYTSYVEESVTYTASSVLLPALARTQDEKERFNNYIVNATAIYSIIIVPALLGFAAISPTFTKVILTDKWMPCVPYIMIFAVGFLHYPILTIQRPAFLACGRSDITLRITIFQNVISILTIIAMVRYSPVWIAIGTSISLLMYIPLYVIATKKRMGIGVMEQIGPMMRYTIFAFIMAIIIYPMNYFNIAGLLKMILQITTGTGVYVVLLVIVKDKIFCETLKYVIANVRGKK